MTINKKKPLTGEPLIEKARSTHGLIMHNATLAETCLYEIFHHFSQCSREISRAIYFTLDSAQGRRSLVKRVANAKGVEKETQALLKELSEAIQKIVDHRNGIAHSFLILDRDFFGSEIHIKLINPKQAGPGSLPVTEQYLEEAENKSKSYLKTVGQIFEKICKKLGIPPKVVV